MILKYLLYSAVPVVVLLATVIWLSIALLRGSKSWRFAIGFLVIQLGIGWLAYQRYLTPKEYPRTYLSDYSSERVGLGKLASSRGFFVGTAINKSTNEDYRRLVPSEYNSITPENATKWRRMLVDGRIGEYDFSEADAIVDYALEQGVRVRGHTLIWGKFSGRTYPAELDDAIANAENPPGELRRVMRNHIQTVMTHFKGRIGVWDAVNEPLSMDGPYLDKNIFLNTIGRDYIAETFRVAHEVDPSVQLFLNEQFSRYEGELVGVFFDLLEWLVEEDVPIHGIGIQAHNIFKTHDLDEFRRFVDRIADLGLVFEVTEFDARIRLFDAFENPYQAQGDFLASYAKICIDHPAGIGFTVWGLSDASTWFDFVPPFSRMLPNDPLMLDAELRPKPGYWGLAGALKIR